MSAGNRVRLVVAAVALVAVGVALWWHYAPTRSPPALEMKYVYVLVTVEGPAEWQRQHTASVAWQGRKVALPVLFRIRGLPAKGNMSVPGGAEPGERRLRITGTEVPVEVEPAAELRVSNEPGVAMLQEGPGEAGKLPVALVTHVTVAPREAPPELGPNVTDPELRKASENVAEQAGRLRNTSQVIDVDWRP